MGEWIKRLWGDEAVFRTAMRTLLRFCVGILGVLIQQGVIPTGVEGGGQKYGPVIAVLALLVPAGQVNRTTDRPLLAKPQSGP